MSGETRGNTLFLVEAEGHAFARLYETGGAHFDDEALLPGAARRVASDFNDELPHDDAILLIISRQNTTPLREARAAFIESRQATDDIDLMMLSLDALEGVPDATQLRAHLATTSGAATHAPAVDLFDQRFRRLLVAYLAARQGDVELAREAMGSEGASIDGFPALDDLQAVVDAELARAAGDAPRAVQLLKARINGDELYLTHIVMLDALTASGDLRGALAEAQWLAQHRGRAYSEYNSEWILRAYYVGQSSLALLRAADLQWQLKDSSASATSLAAFRKAWNRGTRTNATQLRIEELGTLLAAPHKDPSAPR